MSRYFLALGSWKLRHNEPLEPADHWLMLLPLAQLPAQSYTLALNLQELAQQTAFCLSPDNDLLPYDAAPAFHGERMALAVLAYDDQKTWRITHGMVRLHELQQHVVQFMQAPAAYQPANAIPVWQQIYQFYEAFHIFFANQECYYIKHQSTTELEQKFEFAQPLSYRLLCQNVYTAIDQGELQGFCVKLGDEFENWSYDNYLYEILPNEKGDSGYVSMIHYCKQKNRWDDPMFMYKKKLYNHDSLERWEKNYYNKWVASDKQALLEEYFGYSIRELPPWRRSRCDVGVESTTHGNVFLLAFDECRIHQETTDFPLRQCEVEYVTTRGIPNSEHIYEDFWSLVDQLQTLFTQWNLQPTKTYYSKLTWLRDYEKVSQL